MYIHAQGIQNCTSLRRVDICNMDGKQQDVKQRKWKPAWGKRCVVMFCNKTNGDGALLIEAAAAPLLTLALYFRFVLAVQIARAWFPQQVHKPFHYVHLLSRPQNPNNQTPKKNCFHSNYCPPYLLCLMYICVTCKVTGSKSKCFRRMTREAAFRTVLPVKKRHKEAFEAPFVCFNVLPKAFRRYSEKVTF